MVVYSLALAPLGMGALSIPMRRWAGRLPWRRASVELQEWARTRGHRLVPSRPGRTVVRARQGSRTVQVMCGLQNVDQAHSLNLMYRIEVAGRFDAPRGVVVDGHSPSALAGDPDWAAAIQASGVFEQKLGSTEHVAIEAQRVRYWFGGPEIWSRERLDGAVTRVVEAVSTWEDKNLLELLAERAVQAPSPLHRHGCLRLALRRSSDPTELAKLALVDPEPRIRLEGAAAAPHLAQARKELQEQLARTDDEDGRIRALDLARAVAPELLEPLWPTLICRHPDRSSPRLAVRAVQVADQLRLPRLREWVGWPEAFGEARVAAMEALEARSVADLDSMCLELLTDPDRMVRLAAVDILGRVGGPTAAGPLRRMGSDAPMNSDTLIACRAAVDLIMARSRAESGALSLASSEASAGQLSLLEDPSSKSAVDLRAPTDAAPRTNPNPE